jgi:hypothetical protein
MGTRNNRSENSRSAWDTIRYHRVAVTSTYTNYSASPQSFNKDHGRPWPPSTGRFLKLFGHLAGLLGQVISPSQGLSTYTEQHNTERRWHIHALNGIRAHDLCPSDRNPRLRACGHCSQKQQALLDCQSPEWMLFLERSCIRFLCEPDYPPSSTQLLGTGTKFQRGKISKTSVIFLVKNWSRLTVNERLKITSVSLT